jgi:hypothetical protein
MLLGVTSLTNQVVNLQDLENEEIDEEKAKRAALRGMFHGHILKDYEGKTFEEKYQNYLYRSGIEHCTWIKKQIMTFII